MPPPTTHKDCPPPTSPCPHVGCRHNTYLDVAGRTVNIADRFTPTDPRRGTGCALRMGPMSWAEIGERWGLNPWQVRRIEARALRKVGAAIGKDRAAAWLALLNSTRTESEGGEDGE